MKNQALFSPKDKSKKLKCRLLQFLFGASRVNPFSRTSVIAGFVSFIVEHQIASQCAGSYACVCV